MVKGGAWIKLDDWIANKKAIINLQNADEEYFKWVILAELNHSDIGKIMFRVSKLTHCADRYNWNGLKFPIDIDNIKIFENNNENVLVSVLGLEGRDIYLLRSIEYRDRKVINLLLITEGDNRRYTCIEYFFRLLRSMNAKHHSGFMRWNCL